MKHKDKDDIVVIKGLTKHYGDVKAVVDLDLNIKKGEVLGLLGPNGAGKTTAIRTCLGLLKKTAGNVTIFGMDSHKQSEAIRARTGYLPGDFGLIPEITVQTFLKHLLALGDCKDMSKLEEYSERLDLDLTIKTQTLSKGNRQKVGVVQAFMADQEFIILDEPTAGLDPLIQQEFYKILREEKKAGKTIFMSTHVLAEAELVCDRIAIIRKGRLVVVESIAAMQDKMGKILEVEFRSPVNPDEFKIPGVSKVQMDGNALTLTIHSNIDGVIKHVADHPIINMNLRTYTLDEMFLRYYSDDGGEEE
ncbi:MAG: ABC transporter ATP-binding protein [Thermoplasmata archaeon]|nr:MAG: ABC transporter ATP-binding protein [Thermoplasmata archaeon]